MIRRPLTITIVAACLLFAAVVEASPFPRKYGEAATIDGIPLITAGGTSFKVTPTLAAGDVKISKDGGTLTNITTLPVVTPTGDRLLRVTLSATEMQAARIVVLFVDAAGAEWEDQLIIVETYGNASAQHELDLDVTPIAANVTQIDGSAASATSLSKSTSTVVRGAAVAGTLSNTEMTTDLTEATNAHYVGRRILWTSGLLKDQAARITAYDGTSKKLTYSSTTDAPSIGDTFIIV